MAELTYADYDITIPSGRTSGTVYTTCPKCSHERKASNKNAKCLSIDIDKGLWICNNCADAGSLKYGWKTDPKPINHNNLPAPRVPQQFYPEPTWNFGLKDSIIEPSNIRNGVPGEFDITWYYRNTAGLLTAAKKMHYNWDGTTLKRDHDNPPLFLNTRDSGFVPCLYLEHDLTSFSSATVILVESEKTAALLRRKFKENLESYIFLATGGAKALNDDKLPPLKNRKILICYDCDQCDIDGKNPRGREGAEAAYNKLKSISTAKIVDINPDLTDGTDLADIIDTVTLDYLSNLENQVTPSLQLIWKEIIVKVRPPARVPVISIQQVPICTRGNHSLIIGKKKSRKSLFIVHLIAQSLQQGLNPDSILAFDTEQEREDVYDMRDRIWRVTNKYVTFFSLRGKSYKERCSIIEETITAWHTPPVLVIIDGIRDLMSNINDADESTSLVNLVERITTNNNLHLINVLHINKTDSNARGHIGTELLNKSEINIELNFDPKTTYTEVSCESSRRHAFNTFMFTHSPTGLPEVVGEKIGETALLEDDSRNNLNLIFDNSNLHYSELKDEIKAYFKVGENKSKQLLSDFLKKGWIAKSGPSHSKDTIYKLMISALPLNGNGHHHEPKKDDEEIPF